MSTRLDFVSIAPIGDWPCLRLIENVLVELEERLTEEIDLTENLGAMTTSGRMLLYEQLILRRVIDLSRAIHVLWTLELHIGSLLASRALLETIAMFHSFLSEARTALEKDDFDALNVTVDKFVLGSLRPTGQELPRPLRVGKAIKAFNAVEPLSEQFYLEVSELCHPNGWAMLTEYGTINAMKFLAKSAEANASINFRAVLNCLSELNWLYISTKEFEDMLDKVRYLPS